GRAAVVVAGEPEALDELQAELSRRQVMRWPVPASDFIAHSAQVESLAGPLARDLAGISPQPGTARLFSTVRSQWVTGTSLDAGYWYENLREPVRFADAVRALAGTGH